LFLSVIVVLVAIEQHANVKPGHPAVAR